MVLLLLLLLLLLLPLLLHPSKRASRPPTQQHVRDTPPSVPRRREERIESTTASGPGGAPGGGSTGAAGAEPAVNAELDGLESELQVGTCCCTARWGGPAARPRAATADWQCGMHAAELRVIHCLCALQELAAAGQADGFLLYLLGLVLADRCAFAVPWPAARFCAWCSEGTLESQALRHWGTERGTCNATCGKPSSCSMLQPWSYLGHPPSCAECRERKEEARQVLAASVTAYPCNWSAWLVSGGHVMPLGCMQMLTSMLRMVHEAARMPQG